MAVELRPELTKPPERIAALPLDRRGYPVPWFVEWIEGEPEFRAADPLKFKDAVELRKCWVCGDKLGAYLAFVSGPMCVVNRTSSEPPCHLECAIWSAINCPFLSRPRMVRREDDVINSDSLGEASLPRNPGVAAVLTTKSYKLFEAKGAASLGWLIEMGPPLTVEWYTEGRKSTRREVVESIAGGLPTLRKMCDTERTALERLDAHKLLSNQLKEVERWLPK